MPNALVTYDRIAPLYDILDGPYEVLWKRRLRADLFRGLTGTVLDAGCGTGCNIVAYPPNAHVVAVDASAPMLAPRARIRATRLGRAVDLRPMDLTDLALPDESFDAIVSTFVFMCIPDDRILPALRELRRVLKPGGRIHLVDYCHVAAPRSCGFGMKVMTPWLKATFAGTYDPSTETHFEPAGLRVVEQQLIFGRRGQARDAGAGVSPARPLRPAPLLTDRPPPRHIQGAKGSRTPQGVHRLRGRRRMASPRPFEPDPVHAGGRNGVWVPSRQQLDFASASWEPAWRA